MFNVNRYTTDQIRTHSNNIILAASSLDTKTKPAVDKKQFIDIILREAEKINQNLNQSHLLVNFKEIALKDQNLITELEHAIDTLSSDSRTKYKISVKENITNTNIIAPSGIYRHIFEQILTVHNMYREESSTQSVTIKEHTSDNINIVFETTLNDSSTNNINTDDIVNYLFNLTEKMKVKFKHIKNQKTNNIQTSLIIRMESCYENK